MISNYVTKALVDADRISVTGASNGAMMTMRLLCESAIRFKLAVPVIGSLPKSLESTCRIRVPAGVYLVGGDQDPLMPFEGGHVKILNRRRGEVLGFPRTAALLAAQMHCKAPPASQIWPDRVAGDETSIEELEWRDCEMGGHVHLLRIVGGGHRWPSSERPSRRPKLTSWALGKQSEEIDLSAAIVRWMKNTSVSQL